MRLTLRAQGLGLVLSRPAGDPRQGLAARGRVRRRPCGAGERAVLVFDFGDRSEGEFMKNDDGTWSRVDDSQPPANWELQLRALTAARREGLSFRAAPRGPVS